MPKLLSQQLFARASQTIPGAVNSPVRAWRAVGGNPLFVQRARGSHLWDVDGQEYIDYVGSWGALLAGHAHPKVLSAIHNAMRDGTSFGAPTAREVELAEAICATVASVEMVRLVSSGTEATMSAIRLARGATGRAKIMKFSGCYHGHVDALLVRAGSGAATFGVPDSAGVPEAIASQTLVADFNNLEMVRDYFVAEGEHIAAVIVEPVVGNMGVLIPDPPFLQGLREITSTYGTLLIFDEVMTGYRLALGGAQELYRIDPDLSCFGKIIGGGLPLAAFGGKRAVMEKLSPLGPVYQAGTLSGNPLAVAAGLQMLELVRAPGTFERLEQSSARLEGGLADALSSYRGAACVNRAGSMWTLFFGESAVRDANDARRCNTETFGRWFHGMLSRGIYLPPSQFEAAFVSLAHSEDDIDATIQAAREVLAELN